MANVGYYAPHETRMLALETAVEFVCGDARKHIAYSAEDVVGLARKFEAYLTEKPLGDYVSSPPRELAP